MKNILVIRDIQILNANALSSPYSVGFPPMTAWLGAVHALERKLRSSEDYKNVRLPQTAVICHEMNLQTHKHDGDYVHSIIGTGNPLNKKGERPPFIEEARCHLRVSLVVEYQNLGFADRDEFATAVTHFLAHMKIASGDILSFTPAQHREIDDESSQKKLLRQLMPGYCLIERRDLMEQSMNEGLDCIDALLEHLKVHHCSSVDDEGKVYWEASRKSKGWLVPIATGFHGLTEVGHASNQRDPLTPHRFAESIVTLGEFIMPYRMNNIEEMFWHYETNLNQHLYLCTQGDTITQTKERDDG